jgi:hypothetical protein
MIREVAVVWAIAALQAPAPAPAPGAQTPAPRPVPGAMVTVEGCVRRVEPPATGGATAGAAQPPTLTRYVLVDPSSPDTATGTAGSTPRPDATTSPGATAAGTPPTARRMYVLRAEASSGVEFAAHVGHTVRVTGATTAPMTTAPLAGRSPEATPTPGATAPPGATGSAFDTANLPTLAVTTLSMVADRCK